MTFSSLSLTRNSLLVLLLAAALLPHCLPHHSGGDDAWHVFPGGGNSAQLLPDQKHWRSATSTASSSSFIFTALAGVPACNCGKGAVASAAPKCSCICPNTLIPPRCLYDAQDSITMQLWLNIPIRSLSSDGLTAGLRRGLGVTEDYNQTASSSTAVIRFLTMDSAAGKLVNTTQVYIRISGLQAARLKIAVAKGETWVQVLGIESAFDQIAEPDPVQLFFIALAQNVYLFNDGRFSVSFYDIGWIGGCLIVGAIVLCIDFAFYRNHMDEDDLFIVETNASHHHHQHGHFSTLDHHGSHELEEAHEHGPREPPRSPHLHHP